MYKEYCWELRMELDIFTRPGRQANFMYRKQRHSLPKSLLHIRNRSRPFLELEPLSVSSAREIAIAQIRFLPLNTRIRPDNWPNFLSHKYSI